MIGGSWVVLAIVLAGVLCVPPNSFGLFPPPMQLSILLVSLLICSLPCSLAAAGARLLLKLLRARRDGGQTMRCP